MLKQSKKYLTLATLGILAIIFLGIVSPKIVDYYSSNWSSRFDEIKSDITTRIEKNIFEKELILNQLSNKLKLSITTKTPKTTFDLLEIVTASSYENISVNIFSNNKLIGWNKDEIVSNEQLKEVKKRTPNNGVFFLKTPLHIYLSKIDFINNYFVLTAIEVEKRYQLSKKKNDNFNFIHDLGNEFNSVISIQFDDSENPNGINLNNSKGIIIGSIIIKSISRDADTAKLARIFELIQSLVLIFTFVILALWLYQNLKTKGKFIKFIFILSVILFGRFLLFWLNISELIGFSNLINPIYFSSTFGNGITKSPLELFITVVTVLIISLIIYRYTVTLTLSSISKKSKIIVLILLFTFGVLLYNSFASTIRSIIFDSSILYFKYAVLFGSYQTSFMYLTILFIGLITVLVSISIFTILNHLTSSFIKFSNTKYQLICFLIFSFILIIAEIIFSKSSFLLVLIYSSLIYITAYYWINHRTGKTSGALVLLLSSSILSISFLNFFNSELERNSLKTIANEMTRSNIEFYEYYIDNAIEVVQKDFELKETLLLKKTDFDEVAFSIWTNTGLPANVKSSAINIIDTSKSLLGSFSYDYNNQFHWSWGNKKDRNINRKHILGNDFASDSKTFSALVPIETNNSLIGYVEIIAHYNGFNIDITDGNTIFSKLNSASDISVNSKLLKVFEFTNDKLNNYYTNVFLTEQEIVSFTNSILKDKNDAWLNIKINNKENIFYLKKYRENEKQKTLAVGLRAEDISWNLFDFFKVFFIHSIMILIFILFLLLFNLKKWKEFQISFRTKILFSLLIISIIPLILLAGYFKVVSDEKNYNAVNYKLGKRADNVEEYVNNYITSSTLTEKTIFDKAVRDLGISFSLFDGKELLYSAEGNYYKAGLLPKIINPLAYLSLNVDGLQEVIVKENIEDVSFNSLYHRINIGKDEYTIKISDLFNKFQLPMTGIELNVILFGTYSLAILLIIILSTFLANQISAPIEKLTKATRSVGRGDMDIQIDASESGEIKELIDGFNLMVRELKRNQVELAEVERESAWREMAKQVAHEIKNPLTPMKLAVQHLVVAHKDKSNKFDSIFNKVTKTIINQIDTLKNIASEFSSFAKMPSMKLEEIDLVKIITDTTNLFIEEKCDISVVAKSTSINLLSDKEQTQRMFVNLIRNAIQANANEILISIANKGKIISIEIADNGTGIKEEIEQNIFEENFTTKKSGMGLGLSLTKRFLNMINGIISVKETSPTGTVLLIEIRIP